MTQISRKVLNKEIESRMMDIFFDSVARAKTREQAEKLLADWLSPTEKIMLAKRLSIAMLLMQQYDQRRISKLLRVGLETVSKVSRSLRNGVGGYASVISAALKEEKLMEFLDKLDDTLANLFPPRRDWSRWRQERWKAKMDRQKPY